MYKYEIKCERDVLFVVRRDGPVAICDFPAKWVRAIHSLLDKGYIKRAGIPSFVEITPEGEKYFMETF